MQKNTKHNKWTQKDDEFLIKNYPIHGYEFCSEKLNRPANGVRARATKLNVRKTRPWMNDEKTFLKQNWDTLGLDKCSQLLNRTSKATRRIANKLGLYTTNYWSDEEIQFLRENFTSEKLDYCAIHLKRKRETVRQKGYEIGLNFGVLWTQADEEFLIKNYASKGTEFCAKYLERTREAIVDKAQKLHLLVSRELKSKQTGDWFKNNPKEDSEYKVCAKQFVNFETPEAVYVLGFIWGDGHIKIAGKYQRYVMIEIANDDYLDLKHIFDKTGEWPYRFIKRRKPHYKDVASLCLSQKILVEFLRENDFAIKSKTDPHTILSKVPKHLIPYFILGWFDSDGGIHFSKNKRIKSVYFAAHYNHNWENLTTIFDELDIKYSIRKTISSKGRSSCLSFNNYNSIHRFYDYIYQNNNIRLSRKYNIFTDIFNYERNKKEQKIGSRFCGVKKNMNCETFSAQIQKDGKVYRLGGFKNEIEAAKSYDTKAKELFGMAAKLNFPS